MADFPTLTQDVNEVTIGPWSPESIGTELSMWAVTSASAAWPTANRAIYIPFNVYAPLIAVKIGVNNGATASGNMDAGIYDDQQNQLVAKGSTAQSGTNTIQTLDITDTLLLPGSYYLGLAMDGTTGTTIALAATTPLPSAAGVLGQSTAFALPSPATFAAAADAYIPFVYLTARTLI